MERGPNRITGAPLAGSPVALPRCSCYLDDEVHLMKRLNRNTVLRMTLAVRLSSCWERDSVSPSSMWPSWCMMA
ncbi:hypothetical protein EYF80_026905 [Liparis tanakae]|uniref:Uncharacterized protein n=1 Tax=Liparis tanakae TaxID=230148 RepID=A0A4Z2HBC8_9TELE|nr:hypothetical protein EYF80_026905 [Liparis tanakae]